MSILWRKRYGHQSYKVVMYEINYRNITNIDINNIVDPEGKIKTLEFGHIFNEQRYFGVEFQMEYGMISDRQFRYHLKEEYF